MSRASGRGVGASGGGGGGARPEGTFSLSAALSRAPRAPRAPRALRAPRAPRAPGAGRAQGAEGEGALSTSALRCLHANEQTKPQLHHSWFAVSVSAFHVLSYMGLFSKHVNVFVCSVHVNIFRERHILTKGALCAETVASIVYTRKHYGRETSLVRAFDPTLVPARTVAQPKAGGPVITNLYIV